MIYIGLIIIGVVGLLLLGLFLSKKNVFRDEDNDYIPDYIEEAFDDAKKRAKEVYKETKDVGKAIKEVGNQIGDIPKAVAGKKRSGRK